jgi:hypothetical protein
MILHPPTHTHTQNTYLADTNTGAETPQKIPPRGTRVVLQFVKGKDRRSKNKQTIKQTTTKNSEEKKKARRSASTGQKKRRSE